MARIRELDALRGFAVCGIMLVNTWQHVDPRPLEGAAFMAFVEGRFYPIFSFLFGVSFALFLRSHDDRLIMLRRLAVLALFGAGHWWLMPGEVLLPYALLGVGVLLPASYLPKWLNPVLGVVVLCWAVVAASPWILIGGLFLLGLACVDYGGPKPSLLVFLCSLVALGVFWMVGGFLSALAGAAVYASGFLLLSPRVFEPLGRMALTNYVSSSFVIIAAQAESFRSVVVVTAVTLVVQWCFSAWWLSRFRYGPLEWVWRCLTWMRVVPNRQTVAGDRSSAGPDPDRPRAQEEPGGRA
ncbi:DUF418 domain-containing protein [Herbidospora daliensis]|uniref:DUF418 domain-containing protein n=1 Tax=Herbidospora daliensis TaxID=295585 RepID=UPI000780BF79|nr:DUF418 domain-containing protein [Herbidospora daliensis]